MNGEWMNEEFDDSHNETRDDAELLAMAMRARADLVIATTAAIKQAPGDDQYNRGGFAVENPTVTDAQLHSFDVLLSAIWEWAKASKGCGHVACAVKGLFAMDGPGNVLPITTQIALVREVILRRTLDAMNEADSDTGWRL